MNSRHRLTIRALLVILPFALCSFTAGAASSPTASQVLVVYNSNWTYDGDGDGVQDSLQVANYYVAKRGVPSSNVLGVACSTGTLYYYSSYTTFYNEIVAPIKSKLATLGPTNISVILFCYGVPFALPSGTSMDNAIMSLNYLSSSSDNTGWYSNPYFDAAPGYTTSPGHFSHTVKFSGTDMYLVGRIDAADVNRAMNLVDQALYGEAYIASQAGYYNGNAYVDSGNGQPSGALYTDSFLATDSDVMSGNYNSYYAADKNMAFAEHYINASGFPLKWENTAAGTSQVIGNLDAMYSDGTSAHSAPRALFYGGWYNFGNYNDVWEWLPGSVACDLNSDSLSGPRTSGGFCGNALYRGATCVCGVLGEPYLNGHQRPNILLYYMLQGYTFAEASTLCNPTIGGWMPIAIGDPLYAPLKGKTLVKDTSAPQLASGYPTVSGALTSGTRTINVAVQSSVSLPEVVRVQVQYGFTTAYGLTASSGQGYWRITPVNLTGLQGNSTYHYRLILTDPVGNTTTTGDFTFTTGAVPNSAPTAQSQTVILGHDTSKAITLLGTDPDGNALSYSVVSGPAHGTVNVVGGTATYTPAAGYNGSDSFTFMANDGALNSNVATVSLSVMPTSEATIVLQQGLNGYTGAKDTWIYDYSANIDTNYGGSTQMATYGNGDERVLLGFDISSIPNTATISSASLQLYCEATKYASAPVPLEVFRLTHSWVEGTSASDGATWRQYNYNSNTALNDWVTAGGDYDPTIQAQISTGGITALSWINWDVRSLVQGWTNGSYSNNGVLIQSIGSGGVYTYVTKEYTGDPTLRPKLVISYFPASTGSSYTITASAGSGGTITPSGSVSVSAGANQTFAIAANSGYSIANVTVDGTSVGAVSSYTFNNVSANHTIAATFNTITYTITASAGTGGSISPSGAVSVNSGASKTFSIAPNAGYAIAGVTVDGTSVGAVSSYTFTNVTANHTISATFNTVVVTYTINASAGTGGTITPSGSVSVTSGGSQTFSISPNAGYTIAGVTVDGSSVGAVSSYTFNNVTANHTIAATFTNGTNPGLVTLKAVDQFGQVAGAQLAIYPQTSTWYPTGTQVQLTVGSSYYVMGSVNGILGTWNYFTIQSNTTEIDVPFWTTTLTALDQNGTSVPNAQVDLYTVTGTPFNPGTQLSFPQGATIYSRGVLNGLVGNWSPATTVNSSLVAFNASFQSVLFTAVASDGVTVLTNTTIDIYGSTLSPTPNNTQREIPDPNNIYVRALQSGTDVSGWDYVAIDSTTNQIVIVTNVVVNTPTFTIAASAGAGGTITPSGSVSVTSGGSQAFSIAANSGYVIAGVTVDGTSIGAVSSYTFNNVTANHTILATFNGVPVITSAPFASPNPATAGQTVTFTAAATDPDGEVPTYSWDFGDNSNGGSGATVTHSYTAAGTYTATVTISDAQGAKISGTVKVTVNAVSSNTVYVASIVMTLNTTSRGKSATATVGIVNNNGAAVSGATVTGTWSGLSNGSSSGKTGANGTVALTSSRTKQTGTFTFTVTNISAPGYSYAPGSNVVTSASIGTNGQASSGQSAAAIAPDPAPVTNATSSNLSISVLTGSAKFSVDRHDACSVQGVIGGLPASFAPSGQNVTVNVGGAQASFTLDAKGHAKSANGVFALKAASNGNAGFTAKLVNGTFGALWGFDPTANASNAKMPMTVAITINGNTDTATVTVTYNAKADIGVKFKN